MVRPFNHIGPGQSPSFAVSALAKRIVEADGSGATEIPVGNLSARRDFTDVRDVVARLPAADRVRAARERSTTCARGGTSPSRRSPTAC